MLPASFQYIENSEVEEENDEIIYPSYTYKLDMENGRVQGMTDELDAVRQAVYKMLYTDRYSEIIYDEHYGCDLYVLRGTAIDYAELITPTYIEDCLLQDDRIEAVEDIKIETIDIDTLFVSFTVQTIFGNTREQVEVKVNG